MRRLVVKPVKTSKLLEKLREMTDLELRQKLNDTREELFNLRFQGATGHLDDFTRIRQVRKEIARINTVMREKELEAKHV